MNKSTFTVIFLFLGIWGTNSQSNELNDSNQVFNWAEFAYPEIFHPAGATTIQIENYYARYYSGTDSWLGSKDGIVYVLGSVFNDLPPAGLSIKSVGTLQDYVELSNDRCTLVELSVTRLESEEISVECDDNFANIISDTYPNHDLMNGITGTNEQIPVPAPGYTSPVKLSPEPASEPVTIDAALGVAVNGVPIYDYSAQGELDIYNYDPNTDTLLLGQLDNCGGHAGRGDDYHYHATPVCMIESMPYQGDNLILGWGFDGYPLFGENNPDGSPIGENELDICNGKPDEFFGYRYHTSTNPPYVFQCLTGVVDQELPRVSPLQDTSGNERPFGTPPQGGVDALQHTVDSSGVHELRYEYQGITYYTRYSPSDTGNCYQFETKTVTNNGIVEMGEYCR